jgi:2-polyprenyl-6-hydroxyphenyl methylase/3-demethylubiquinone-9 3-methyltransferase
MSPQVANNYTSIDPDEVARFEALANTWWDTSGPFWPLHRLNELRVGYIRDTVCRAFGRDAGSSFPLQGLSILDIGCGGGILSEAMAALGGEVHSIDVVARNIAIARHHAGQSNLSVRYEALAAEQLVCRRDCYDVVLNMEVVEHVADLSSFLRACSQLVKGAASCSSRPLTELHWPG